MFSKDIHPDWLRDDEEFDELTRGKANNAISQWAQMKALIKQNELTEKKAAKMKRNLKKDQEVKLMKVEEGEDIATSTLHNQRFLFCTPLIKPDKYWDMYTVKWPEVDKKVHLAHLDGYVARRFLPGKSEGHSQEAPILLLKF